MSLCDAIEAANRRNPWHTSVRNTQAARIREAGKRAKIHALTDRIVNGVWDGTLSPIEIDTLKAELAILTGAADFV